VKKSDKAGSEHLLDIGPYYADQDGTLHYRARTKGGDGFSDEVIANHTPIASLYVRRTDGFTTKDEVEFVTVRNGKKSPPVSVDRKTILSTQPHINFGMGDRVIPGRGHIPRYSELMQMQFESMQPIVKYTHTGWNVSEDNKKRVFLNGGYSITKDGLTDKYSVELDSCFDHFCFFKVDEPDEECLRAVWNGFRQVLPGSKAIPLLAYVFMTPLNEMLRGIGREPCFSLYIVGRTGSYKSSVAKLLLNFFGKFSYSDPAPCSFNDTPGSMEKKLAVGADIPLLVDDRRPSQSRDRAQFETAEKYLSSAIGDRAARGRLNADGSAKTPYIPRANAIVTAEEAFQNIGSSSTARAVTVEFEKDTVDFQAMYELQQKADSVNRTMQLYIQWVIQHFDNIKEACPGQLEKYRKEFADEGHARLATAFSQLLLGYRMFLLFMEDKQIIDKDTVGTEMRAALMYFREMCVYQNKLIEGDSPTTMFLEALRDITITEPDRVVKLIKHRSIRDPKKTYFDMIGYSDAQYYYFIPRPTLNAVIDFYRKSDYSFPASRISLQKELLRERIVVPAKSGSGERADVNVTIDSKAVRCWRVRRELIDKNEEGDTDER